MAETEQLHALLGTHGVVDFMDALREEEGVNAVCDLYNAFDSGEEADAWARERSVPGRCEDHGRAMAAAWQAAGRAAKRHRK